MIRYHGGPIWPVEVARHVWKGRHAFVSFYRPEQINIAAMDAASFALDNGAFSAWRNRKPVTDWSPYWDWCDEWLRHPACDWAVIPDVVGGSESKNDALIDQWPHGHRGVPVWHLNESLDRLQRLATEWPRVALGSCAEYNVSRPTSALGRLAEALPLICDEGQPITKLHGLRMLRPELVGNVPLATADSTNLARNIVSDGRWTHAYAPKSRKVRADVLAERIEATPAATNCSTLMNYATKETKT